MSRLQLTDQSGKTTVPPTACRAGGVSAMRFMREYVDTPAAISTCQPLYEQGVKMSSIVCSDSSLTHHIIATNYSDMLL